MFLEGELVLSHVVEKCLVDLSLHYVAFCLSDGSEMLRL